MKTVDIKGANINLDALGDVKNLKALKATNIFSHVPDAEQDAAYVALWEILSPKKDNTPLPETNAATAATDSDAANKE
jgi:hypothetical protein